MEAGRELCRASAIGLLLIGCSGGQSSVDRALERMVDQPRYDVYESGPFFRDGKVLQRPPRGTIAREALLGSALNKGRGSNGGYALEIPLVVTPELLAVGRSKFRIFCGACHGVGGYGGSIVASNMTEARPPSLRTPELARRPLGYLYRVVRSGFGDMPPYAAELSVGERWAVVAYLRELQGRLAAAPDERIDSLRGAVLKARDSAAQARRRKAQP